MSKRGRNRIETRTNIFEAAAALMDVQGYENTSVEEICEAAGVGRATFFRHFDTKAGLLREHNRRLAEDAKGRISAQPATGTLGCLEAVAEAIHDAWVDAGPGLRELGADAAALADPSGRRTHPELLDLVVEVVRRGRAAGELSSDLPPPLTGYLIVTNLAAATAWWFAHPDDDLRQLLHRALDACLHGIAASPAMPRAPAGAPRGRGSKTVTA